MPTTLKKKVKNTSIVRIEDDPVALDLYKNSKITIGTDLEISLHPFYDRQTAVTGLSFWETGKDGKVGTDGKTKFFQYLVELRPDYAYDGRALLDNILKLVKKEVTGKPTLKNYMWKAGTGDFNHKPIDCHGVYYLPKGGHIHFGSIQFEESFIYAMDLLMAPIILMLEDPIRATIRRVRRFDFNGGTYYGQLGGWRASQHAPTWEYRTLPNFCLNFTLSEAMFNISKAILFECMENKSFSRSLKSKINNLKPDVLTFNFCRKEYYRSKIEKIFAILSKLRMLDNKYGKDLLSRLRRYLYNHETWNLDCDMLVDFKLCDPIELFKFRTENAAKSKGIPEKLTNQMNKQKAVFKENKTAAHKLLLTPEPFEMAKNMLDDLTKCTIENVQTINAKLGKQKPSEKIDSLISHFFCSGGEADEELEKLSKKLKNTAHGKSLNVDEISYEIGHFLRSVESSNLIL